MLLLPETSTLELRKTVNNCIYKPSLITVIRSRLLNKY